MGKQSMNKIHVEPCPWCRKTDKIELDEALGTSADGKPQIAAGCERCEITGPFVKYYGPGKGIPIPTPQHLLEASAIAWNGRAKDMLFEKYKAYYEAHRALAEYDIGKGHMAALTTRFREVAEDLQKFLDIV